VRGTLLAASLAIPLFASVAAEQCLVTDGGAATVSAQSLIGHWRKATEESCASRYPAEVRLRSGGVSIA